MSDQSTDLESAKDSFARQAREALAGLPAEDFTRVIRHTLAGVVDTLLRSTLRATRGLSDKQVLAHALRSHAESIAATAHGLDEVSGKVGPEARHAISTRTAALLAEAEALEARAAEVEREISEEGQNRG